MTSEERRREIYRKYARPETGAKGREHGKPMQCRPSLAERTEGKSRNGGTYKIIFDTQENAEAAARELGEVYGEPMKAYLCKFGKHSDHFHVTNESPAARMTKPASRRTA